LDDGSGGLDKIIGMIYFGIGIGYYCWIIVGLMDLRWIIGLGGRIVDLDIWILVLVIGLMGLVVG